MEKLVLWPAIAWSVFRNPWAKGLLITIFLVVDSYAQSLPLMPNDSNRNRSSEALPAPALVASQEGAIRMALQGDVKLDALVGFVSQRLGIRYEYSDAIAARKVTIRTPQEIPISALNSLLGSVLRTEGLAIVDSNTPGWKRIVEIKEIGRYATQGNAPQVLQRDGPASVVTQIFLLRNLKAKAVSEVLKPFLSGTDASLVAVEESNSIIVTDYASSIKNLSDLLSSIDSEGQFQFYEARNQPAQVLAEQVKGIFSAQSNDSTPLKLITETVGKRIVIAGNPEKIRQTLNLLQKLDVSMGMTTQAYRIRNTTAERIDKLLKSFIEPPNDEKTFTTTIDEDGNLLIVRASEEVHRQIVKLISEFDIKVESTESPIQFYKLKNASALDVLFSLLALQEVYGPSIPGYSSVPAYSMGGSMGIMPGVPGALGGFNNNASPTQNPAVMSLPLAPEDPNRQDFNPSRTNPLARPTPAAGPNTMGGNNNPNMNQGFAGNMAGARGFGQNGIGQQNGMGQYGLPAYGGFNGMGGGMGGGMGMGGGGGVATLPGGARVSADVATNSLIVYAPSNVQQLYAKLIESLDQRRPQVLIEAQVIAIDTTDNYTLGVEVSTGDRTGVQRLFKFNSFGLSEVNRDTGHLRLIPGLGFNGTLIDPEVADVVVRALANHTRARVLAAPKILVNDNSTGKLESVTSIPFTSVNASETVSTTSLGGNQQAGTMITVTPHINEDDHLQLDFDVEFSTFSNAATTGGLPPPRQIDRVGSTVTIPDGKTVVVGGLKRIGDNYTFSGLPWLEKIPILRTLTSRTDSSGTSMSFFLFIRPIVLRDSRFRDLRFLSDGDIAKSGAAGEYPQSEPLLIR